MNFDELYDGICKGLVPRDDARKALSLSYLETAKHLTLDIGRELRNGIPEIIYGEFKAKEQVMELAEAVLTQGRPAIVSRFPDNAILIEYFQGRFPVVAERNLLVIGELPLAEAAAPSVLVVSGGSSDHDVAAEVDLTLRALGIRALLFEDRGIALPTRVLDALRVGLEANIKAAVVIAGMEASLATYVASMLPVPVIGVPTSVGYGYHAQDAALISMLSSCTPNLCVVNIDGGLRGAVVAALIARG